MTSPRTWQSVQDEVLRRIHDREWKPGEFIPNEADLAREFGCARTTVNRALRSLAENGLLDRRRKAGTRVAPRPVAKATLDIVVIRHEVERLGKAYAYGLIDRAHAPPSIAVSSSMSVDQGKKMLRLRALHKADNAPYALEDRWINLAVVPGALNQNFDTVSANEWLLENVPYTRGDIDFSAVSSTDWTSQHLACAKDTALLAMTRVTWDQDRSVTMVQVLFAPGHRLRTSL